MDGGVVMDVLQAVALKQLQSSGYQSLFHLWTVENIKVEQNGMMCVEKHMGGKAEPLHCL